MTGVDLERGHINRIQLVQNLVPEYVVCQKSLSSLSTFLGTRM